MKERFKAYDASKKLPRKGQTTSDTWMPSKLQTFRIVKQVFSLAFKLLKYHTQSTKIPMAPFKIFSWFLDVNAIKHFVSQVRETSTLVSPGNLQKHV